MRGIRKSFDGSGLPPWMNSFMNGPKRGAIYFLVADDLHLVKIGATNRWKRKGTRTWMEMKRLIEIDRGCPVPLRLAAFVVATPYGTETQHHRYFANYRLRTNHEWFWYLDELKEYVDRVAAFQESMGNYEIETERYKQMMHSIPDARLPVPKMPLKGPWLDFSAPPPILSRIPTGWQLT